MLLALFSEPPDLDRMLTDSKDFTYTDGEQFPVPSLSESGESDDGLDTEHELVLTI